MKIHGIKEEHTLFFHKGKGRWVLKRKDAAGTKWVPTTAPREIAATQTKAAIAWARTQLVGPKPEAKPEPPPVDQRTVADFFEVWKTVMEKRPSPSADTRAGYVSVIRSNVLPYLGTKRLAEVDVPACCALVRALVARPEPLSALSIGNTRKRLALFLDDAQAEGWLPLGSPNPARHKLVRKELPKQARRSGKLIVHLPAEHAQALIDATDVIPLERRFRYYLGFGFGLRDGEIAALRESWFRLDEAIPQVEIVASVSQRTRTEQAPKTESSRRVVPVPSHMVPALEWWFAEGFELAYGQGPIGAGGLLFVGRRGEPTRPRSAEHLRKDLEALGLPTTFRGFDLTFHATRRSCGTWLAALDVSIETIGALLGHEGETITEQAYVAPSLDRLAEAIEKMPLRWSLVPSVVPLAPRGAAKELESLEEAGAPFAGASSRRYHGAVSRSGAGEGALTSLGPSA